MIVMIFFFEHLHQRETIINAHQFILIDMLQFELLLSCDYFTIRIVHKCKRENIIKDKDKYEGGLSQPSRATPPDSIFVQYSQR